MAINILRRRGKSPRETAVTPANTVRKHLAGGGPLRYRPRAAQPGRLDRFRDYLVKRVEAARPHWIPATVLAREPEGDVLPTAAPDGLPPYGLDQRAPESAISCDSRAARKLS